jgi:choline kinase
VISAAGIGSRLELNMPKCLVDVGPRKIIDYQLDLLVDIEDVRIVVGFMEEAVIKHVRSIRSDVVFVRNPDYRTTTNSYSLHLGSCDLADPFVILDGDLLIEPKSFRDFLACCDGAQSVVGVTDTKTEEAVFAHLDNEKRMVTGFSMDRRGPYEWCGIAYFRGIQVAKNAGFVFREIERHLPLPMCHVVCHEVDTPQDLDNANAAIASYGLDEAPGAGNKDAGG